MRNFCFACPCPAWRMVLQRLANPPQSTRRISSLTTREPCILQAPLLNSLQLSRISRTRNWISRRFGSTDDVRFPASSVFPSVLQKLGPARPSFAPDRPLRRRRKDHLLRALANGAEASAHEHSRDRNSASRLCGSEIPNPRSSLLHYGSGLVPNARTRIASGMNGNRKSSTRIIHGC